MEKSWEEVLGEWVLFERFGSGRWSWRTRRVPVNDAPGVTYATMKEARIAAAVMLAAAWLLEEIRGEDVPSRAPPPGAQEGGSYDRNGPPPQDAAGG
jgi:hypothetical protein